MGQLATALPEALPGREPIAIVGIGCRLPGGADNPDRLWRLLCEGFDAIGPIPSERFDAEELYDERPATPGKIMTRWGGFLQGIDAFDASFFGIAPREAERLDPQQRLLLEVAWEALADAGIPATRLAGSNAGVFVGMWLNEYESRLFADPADVDLYTTTGTGRSTASGRLSYFFDLYGPSITIDTACSSSLVAVHLACRSIWSGECDVALAGGANIILQPQVTIAFSQARMMSADGRCKFGDARADGFVRSEGAAMVALKPLSAALADGDPIYAVVRGSAVTNDGRSSGFMATPGQAGQEEMLRRAYAHAGVDPGLVQYVEAHGTGTSAGDPVELGALGAVLGASRSLDQPCLVGSLKTNIGHTEGAAGVAGLIKAALALRNCRIPASLHLREPNPSIPWPELGLEVCTELRPWPATAHPALAGVSSFGIAGTNAHVVLAAAPSRALPATAHNNRPLLLPISANTPGALAESARRFDAALARADGPAAADLCYTAALRRAHHHDRLAVVGGSTEELQAALAAFLRGEQHPGLRVGRADQQAPRVAFVFPGQGSQWPGMARELLRDEPVFRAAIETCDRAIMAETGWSLLQQLNGDSEPHLDEIDVIQPALFAIQVGLSALWQSWGITPSAVVGHSMGEVAAAYVAGALSLEDAAAVICRRSRLLRRVRGLGAMAVVDLPLAEAGAAISSYQDRLAVAVSNSPRSTVLSGDPAALAAVLAELEGRDVFCRPVNVDVASHSPQMDPLLDELRQILSGISPRPTGVAMYSTVDAAVVEGAALDAAYWTRNLRRPVMFAAGAQQLSADGVTVFIEMSPHPILLPAIEQVLRHAEREGLVLPSLRRDGPELATMLSGLGALYTAGATVQWDALYPAGGRHTSLPAYPWQRERFWYEPAPAVVARRGGHPLLGHALRLASDPDSVAWDMSLDTRQLRFLADHRVQHAVVLPATGVVELASQAAAAAGSVRHSIENISLRAALALPEGAAQAAQLVVEPYGAGTMRFRLYTGDDGADWQLHAEGRLRLNIGGAAVAHEALQAVLARCPEPVSQADHYAGLHRRELAFGAAFQTVERCWLGHGEALGRLARTVTDGPFAEQITLLDGCLQLAVALLPAATTGQTWLPVGIERLERFAEPERDAELWGHAVVASLDESVLCCDVYMLDGAGRVLAEARGLRLERAGRGRGRRAEELLYELSWIEAPRPPAEGTAGPGSWIIFAEHGAGRGLAAQLAARGERCVLVEPGTSYRQLTADTYALDPDDDRAYAALLRDALDPGDPPCRGIVYAWASAIAADAPDAPAQAETLGCAAPLALVRAVDETGYSAPPRLWLLTRGAQAAGGVSAVAAEQAVIWGLGRVVASERPELRCTMIDLDPAGSLDSQALVDELWAGAPGLDEQQVALRGARRFVARLARMAVPELPPTSTTAAAAAYRIVAAEPGLLESVRLRRAVRRAPADGEIEVRVEAAALNFLDVLKALGISPGFEPSSDLALGAECAGTVVAVGHGVSDFAPGDAVVAITPSYRETSMLGAYVTLPAAFAALRPDGMTAQEASTLPVAMMTAYYALHELGGLHRGQRVLIHSASGGVGLAALQLCRRAGAEVFATAGSEEKRAYLHSLGVDHVFDSRTLDFSEQILAQTGGRGVDLVLNSLAGEAIAASLATLAPGGRFLEIGKRDIYANSRIGLEPFKRNRSFFAIDLAGMTEDEPESITALLRKVIDLATAGEIRPLPFSELPIDEAAEAFRTMAQARHIGKLVLTVPDEPVVIEAAVRSDGSYLITGGLGALGLAVARRLVERGAQYLALLGRSAPTAEARTVIDELEALGARVLILEADVADIDQLGAALERIAEDMPPLRGVVHAAGLLADATLAQLDRAQLRAALAPKLAGSWNLHRLTRRLPLDFFVLFSSVSALLGVAGQANYAAGNAFMDALAHRRRADGLPATSINWGPWAELGLAAAEANRGARLSEHGLVSFGPAEGLDAFELLLRSGLTQAVVLRLDAERWAAYQPSAAPLLALLRGTTAPAVSERFGLRESLLAVTPGRRRRSLLEDAVRDHLAAVLRLAPERIERQRPLKTMGLDSLMALELRNRLEAATGLTLSATIAWNYPTVAVLAEFLAGRMELPLEAEAATAPLTPEPVASELDQELLTHDELEALLHDELAAVDRLLKAE